MTTTAKEAAAVDKVWAAARASGPCARLLAAIGVLILAYPWLQPSEAGRVTLGLANAAVLVAAVAATSRSRRAMIPALVLVVPAILLQVINVTTTGIIAPWISPAASALFMFFVILSLLAYVLRAGPVTADKVHGAVAVYMLTAVFWAMLYTVVESLSPGSFAANATTGPNGGVGPFDLLYFSFVTMSTAGYGDVAPLSTHARSLAILQQVVSVFYVAVLIARLAGLYPATGHED